MVLLSSLLSLALAAGPAPESAPQPRITQTEVNYVEGEGADPVKHTLAIFQPEGQQGLPVLLFFHGGVWQRGQGQGSHHRAPRPLHLRQAARLPVNTPRSTVRYFTPLSFRIARKALAVSFLDH
jgi:hypothetical protein